MASRKRWHKNHDKMAPSKYLSTFQRTLEMLLTNCSINLQLKWSIECILVTGTLANQVPTFRITYTKF